MQLTPVRPALRTVRKQQLLVVEMPDRGASRAGPGEGVEHQVKTVLHLLVGVEHHVAERVVDQPHRQRHLQLPAFGLGQHSATQPDAHHMQLRFRHGPFKPEQEPVVEVNGIVDTVLVKDERLAQGADLQQPMPIGGVAREPGHLEPEHDPGPSHADLGDQMLESLAVGVGAGEAEIAIDHDNALGRPAQGHGPLAQRVLAPRALAMVEHLALSGLTHVQVGIAAQVARGHLLVSGVHAASLPIWPLIMAIKMSIADVSTPVGNGPGEAPARTAAGGAGSSAKACSQAATPRSATTASPWRSWPAPGSTA